VDSIYREFENSFEFKINITIQNAKNLIFIVLNNRWFYISNRLPEKKNQKA